MGMTYKQALRALKAGKKVKLPEWEGYWFMDNGVHKVKLKTGEIVDTPWKDERVTKRKDFEVTEMLMTRLEEVNHNNALMNSLSQSIDHIKKLPLSNERINALTRISEGIMWLGVDLQRLGIINGKDVIASMSEVATKNKEN